MSGTVLHLRIPDEQMAEIDRRALSEQRSRSNMTLRLLSQALGQGAPDELSPSDVYVGSDVRREW
jgi:hypothetical protein